MRIGYRFAALVIGAALSTAVPARAGIIVAVQFVTALTGSTGNELDVTLQNTGATPIGIGGFNFKIGTTDTDITFTSTTINTSSAPYIFVGNSTFGPTISTFLPGQTMDGSDIYGGTDTTCSVPNSNPPPAAFASACVAAGATVGLGNVQFNISPTATTGSFAVTLSQLPQDTSVSDANGANIPITTFTNGQVTITATPEPATALLLGAALASVLVLKRRRVSRG